MAYALKINYADKSNYGAYRSISNIEYIVWHYTANDGDTDEANANYFKRKNLKSSAHYFVDDDSVTISVPDTYVAWSVGGARYSNYKSTGGASLYKICTNANSLNIELCDTQKNGRYDISEKTLNNAIELTKDLMKKYNVPAERVIRHFDVTGKSCPAYYVNNSEWNKVKSMLSGIQVQTVLKKGSKGVEVKELQTHLNLLGYNCGTPDGIFGKHTESAVKNFQKAYGLIVDGKFGSASKRMMETAIAAKKKADEKKTQTQKTGYDLIFNATFYAEHNPDVKKAFGSSKTLLLSHFKSHGMSEGRQACPTFNVRVYKERNADLQKAFGNDYKKYFEHYMTYGYKEKRTVV